PDAAFLYASERVTSRIAGLAVATDSGRLEPVGVWPVETSPRGFAITPCGRGLLAAGQDSNRVAAYAIDSTTGRLTRLADQPAGANPNWIEIICLSALAA